MHPIAEHRGIAPETEPETNRYARVHSQIDCRVDTVTTNLYLSPGTHVALSVAFRTTKPGLITSWRTDKSDHVVGNSVQHRSGPGSLTGLARRARSRRSGTAGPRARL